MVHRRVSSLRVTAKQYPKRPLPRDYSSLAQRAPTPSTNFDWDAALYRFAVLMKRCGYTLTKEQQQRMDDHA